ncbi:MAG: ISKra4 family transposase [Candidatus Eremiobacteraeota bacterium]|nr:ISKra4 family transposase [Candidatus Eremiobacteraeota bacterium]
MKMKIQVVVIADDGEETTQEVAVMEREALEVANLGLSIREGKAILKGIQEIMVGRQVADSFREAKSCPECARSRNVKGSHNITLRTVYGTVQVKSQRLHHCDCTSHSAQTFSPLAELFQEHVTPELLFLESKWSSMISYGLTAKLIEEVLPIDEPVQAVTVRNHVLKVAERMERSLGEEQVCFIESSQREREQLPTPDGPLSVGIDGCYIRAHDKKGCFEVIVGKSIPSFKRDNPSEALPSKSFAFVQTYDEKPKRRLYESLRSQGMQDNQQLTFLSDGADNVRNLQLFLSPEAEHVLDWFHVTMRLTVLRQMAKGLPQEWEFEDEIYLIRQPILKSLESAKWFLWHGNAVQALQEVEGIFDRIGDFDQIESGKAKKFHSTLADFRSYIENNHRFIPNYGERYRHQERISTGFTESAVNQVVAKRMVKKQQMRWSPRGAHLFLQVRTRVLNEELEDVFRDWYPGFRRAS